MNTRRATFGLVASLLAVLTLLAGLAPSASAQSNPGALLATQFFAAIGDEAAAYQLSADAVLHTPEGDFAGRAGLVQFGDALEASFSDLQFVTQTAAQAGDTVIVSLTITGINTGAWQGLDPNCASVAVPAVAMLRVTERTVVNEEALSEHLVGAPVETIETTVVEQWISYDADLLASQIADFNALDPSARPGCD